MLAGNCAQSDVSDIHRGRERGNDLSPGTNECAPMWFEVTRRKHMAVLDFRHSGWDEGNRYFGFCNFAWGEALAKLRKLCEAK